MICPIHATEEFRERGTLRVLFNKANLNLDVINLICIFCGLVFIDHPKKDTTDSGHHHREINQNDIKIKSGVAKYLKSFIKSKDRVLDIGCGYGTLPYLLKLQHPYSEIKGIEMNEQDVQTAKKVYNLDIFHGSLEQFYKPKDYYDVIILHHTFEHFSNPCKELGTISKMLTPDGLIYIAVPNILNINKRPEIFFQTSHPFSYSPYSLNRLAEFMGLKSFRFNWNADYPGGMQFIFKKYSNILEPKKLKGNTEEIKEYIEKIKNKFDRLRKLRNILLFWLPKKMKINIGRIVYLWMKNSR